MSNHCSTIIARPLIDFRCADGPRDAQGRGVTRVDDDLSFTGDRIFPEKKQYEKFALSNVRVREIAVDVGHVALVGGANAKAPLGSGGERRVGVPESSEGEGSLRSGFQANHYSRWRGSQDQFFCSSSLVSGFLLRSVSCWRRKVSTPSLNERFEKFDFPKGPRLLEQTR